MIEINSLKPSKAMDIYENRSSNNNQIYGVELDGFPLRGNLDPNERI